jgi:glycosyltransferase involved in cell wall biosynthesis
VTLLGVRPLRPAPAKKYAPGRFALADGWEIEVHKDRDAAKLQPAEPNHGRDLVTIDKRATAGPCRLVRALDVPAGLARLSASFATSAFPAELLEWAAVLEELPNGHRQFVAKAQTVAAPPGGPEPRPPSRRPVIERLRARIAASPSGAPSAASHVIRLNGRDLARSGPFLLAFQCSSSPGRLAVSEFAVEAVAAEELEGEAPAGDAGGGSEALRTQALSAIARLAAEIPSPYYHLLSQAVVACRNERHLSDVLRTLETVDLPRRGTIAPVEAPLVSVVMPAFERAEVIGAAIRSALCQTYRNIELLVCDDGSRDETAARVAAFADNRVRLLRHASNRGAAAARNTCLAAATGRFVAYLDSDNLWHPRYLEIMLEEFARASGAMAAYASHFDVESTERGKRTFRSADLVPFDLEAQIDRPFIDLNSFVHRRELATIFGGFDETLTRRQDYDLVARYCWVHEPRHVPVALNLYVRDRGLRQITKSDARPQEALARARAKVDVYYAHGAPAEFPPWLKKVTVLSWDMSRNHFGKAWSLAEALSRRFAVQLVAFRFFADEIYAPYAGAKPPFELVALPGDTFPGFLATMERALDLIDGDLIYAVKPRLPSFGLALLANRRSATPVVLEANDLETVVAAPGRGDRHASLPLAAVLDDPQAARSPHAEIWSRVLDRCVAEAPVVYTHNRNLDIHYGRRCLTMRNIKDETVFDPAKVDRARARAALGLSEGDRAILFGGTVRAHKGPFELAEFVGRLGAPYKLVVAGSRETPELARLAQDASGRVIVLPPQPAAAMAEVNRAADAVVLWLDPAVPASAYQNPYKLTDALAMETPVVATPIGELARLAEREIVWAAPFGDYGALAAALDRIIAGGDEVARRLAAGRRLFLREYSYNAAIAALALGVAALGDRARRYPVGDELADVLAELAKR